MIRIPHNRRSPSVGLLLAVLSVLLSGLPAHGDADSVPMVTVPAPPPGVYRDPDIKWDLEGVRDIRHGWLSADGRTFWCVVDRGEPVNRLIFSGKKVRRDPAFYELDLTTRSITRIIDLPEDGPWQKTGPWHQPNVVYLPLTDRLVGWVTRWKTRKTEAGEIFLHDDLTGRELQSFQLNDPQSPTVRLYPPVETGKPRLARQWRFDKNGQAIWLLTCSNKEAELRLEKVDTQTLKKTHHIRPEWTPPVNTLLKHDPFEQITWRIDEASNELWLAAVIEEDRRHALRWLRFDIENGSLIGDQLIHGDVAVRGPPKFEVSGRYLSISMPGDPDSHRSGPARFWRLPEIEAVFDADTSPVGWYTAGSLMGDGRFLIAYGAGDPNGERSVWRYDRESQHWSWPRRIVVPQGTTHRCFSEDGARLVAFNLIDGRANRLAVYDFSDTEAYNAQLAETLSRQRPQPPAPPPFMQAERIISLSPDDPEISVERRAIPIPQGQFVRATVSDDGKVVGLWLVHHDRQPRDQRGMYVVAEPNWEMFQTVLIEADTGNVIRTLPHPPGYSIEDLYSQTQLVLSADGRWLVMAYAKSNKRLGGMSYPPPPAQTMIHVIDTRSGDIVAERKSPEHWAYRVRVVAAGTQLYIRSFRQTVPIINGYEFCLLPSLEPMAQMQWAWPEKSADTNQDNRIVQDVRYDTGREQFTALMRQVGGSYNGRQVPVTWWVQYFDTASNRPIGRGPAFPPDHGRHQVSLSDKSVIVTYEHPEHGNLIQVYPIGSDRPSWQIDGSNYDGGLFASTYLPGEWIMLRPGVQRSGKPGITLFNTHSGDVIGPLLIAPPRSILWVSPDGRRMMVRPDRSLIPSADRDTAPVLEWITIKPDHAPQAE